MSNFAPQAVFTPYHFEITENARGYWVAKDTQGLIGGVFRTQKDALRFALFEVAGNRACVWGLSRTRPPSHGRLPSARKTSTMSLQLKNCTDDRGSWTVHALPQRAV